MFAAKSIFRPSILKKQCFRVTTVLVLLCCQSFVNSKVYVNSHEFSWGFFAHRKINYEAVFLLPQPLLKFFKSHASFLGEHAVAPDKRRHSVVGEAEKHYIDIDVFMHDLDTMRATFPRNWTKAVEKYGEDSLRANGIGPFSLEWEYTKLVKAFKSQEKERYLRQMADLGHYVADLHVPLHTTVNYNGQLTGQDGIHGFWESRVPELLFEDFDLVIMEPIVPIEDVKTRIWNVVFDSHSHLHKVLELEKQLNDSIPLEKFEIDERNGSAIKTYSKKFTSLYFKQSGRLQEQQMRKAIVMVAQMWYTAWLTAGQPALK